MSESKCLNHQQTANRFWRNLLPLIALSSFSFLFSEIALAEECKPLVTQSPVRPGRVKVDTEKLSPKMESILTSMKKSVIGQPRATEAYVRIMNRASLGIRRRGTAGAILVYGPTGVGKTKAAEDLATAIGGKLIELEGGDFGSASSITSLTGASPTFVGHGSSEPVITQEIIDNARGTVVPVTIVVINELDKTHPEFINWWLKALDAGTNKVWVPKPSSDESGQADDKNRGAILQEVNFKDVIIIATTNAGADLVKREAARIVGQAKEMQLPEIEQAEGVSDLIGLVPEDANLRDKVTETLLEAFKRPEFLGRWDELVPAYPLLPMGYHRVLNIEMARLMKQYSLASNGKGLKIRLTPRAGKWLVGQLDTELGARNLSKLVDRYIDGPITTALGSGEIQFGESVAIDLSSSQKGFDFYTRQRVHIPKSKANEEIETDASKKNLAVRLAEVQKIQDEKTLIVELNTIVETHTLLTAAEAIAILRLVPRNTIWSFEHREKYFPVDYINQKLNRTWSDVQKMLDLNIVFMALNNIKGPKSPAEKSQLNSQLLEIINRTAGNAREEPKLMHDLYHAARLLIERD